MRTTDDLTEQETEMLLRIAASDNPCETGSKEWSLWIMGLIGGYLDVPLPNNLSPKDEALFGGWLKGRRVGDKKVTAV